MRIRKKIIIAISLTAILVLVSVAGIILYYYTHPEAVASLAENYILKATGLSVRFDRLTYSFNPIKIQANGIKVEPVERSEGFSLKIPELTAALTLAGDFGNRHLIVDQIRISDFTMTYDKAGFHAIAGAPKPVSVFGQIVKQLIAYLLFRDIRIDEVKLTDGALTARLDGPVLKASGIHALRNADDRIEIGCTADIHWPEKNTRILLPDFHLATDHTLSLADLKIKGSVDAKRVDVQTPEMRLSDVAVNAEVSLNLKGADLRADRLQIAVGDRLQLNGSLEASAGPPTRVTLTIRKSDLSPQKVLAVLPDSIKGRFPPLTLAGDISIDGRIKGEQHRTGWGWDAALSVRFDGNRFSYRMDQGRLDGTLGGDLKVTGGLSDIRIAADLETQETVFSGGLLHLRVAEASGSFSGEYPVYQVKGFSALVTQATVKRPEKDLAFENIRLQIPGGRVDMNPVSLRFPEIRIESPLIRNLVAGLETNGKTMKISANGEETDLISSAKALKLLPARWQVSGRDSLSIAATLNEKGAWSIDSRIGFRKLGFQDPSGRFMAENIRMDLNVNGAVNLENPSISGTIAVKIANGEVLYDLFYVNLNSNAFFSSGRGSYDIGTKRIQISDLKLGFEEVVSMDLKGGLNVMPLDGVHLRVHIPKTPIKPLFQMFLVEPYHQEKPFLKALAVEGTVSVDSELTHIGPDWMVKGNCTWQEGMFSFGDKGFLMRNIDIDFPVWYGSREARDPGGSMPGAISIGSLALPFLPEQPLTLALSAEPNRLSVIDPTLVKIPGGKILIGPVAAAQVFGPLPTAVTRVTVSPVDMSPILKNIWPHPLSGLLQGTLDPVEIQGNQIKTDGKITARVFDGEITLTQLGAEGIFTAAPLFKLTAQFDDLNLGALTGGTPFGKIDGVLKGYVKDLEIAYGEPQRFDLLLETVKKKGGPQQISIKAVENISRIGSGQSPFIGFTGMFATLFETLGYDKIGIRATLKNDVFRVNGTIKEQGQEYLMKRGGLSGVNIVNQNPDNRISFKDMVKRIKRVTAENKNPVIR